MTRKSSSTKPETTALNSSIESMRVLVVEDNPINVRVIEAILERMGYAPDVCVNGLEAVNSVKSRPYDVIFMDLRMPVMGGIEATKLIRQMFTRDKLFISALTANSDHSDRAACRGVGMNDFIAKPAKPSEIEDVIKRAHQEKLEQSEGNRN